MNVAEHIRSIGGIAHTSTLTASGCSHRAIAAACRAGSVIRVIRGWYSTRSVDDPVVVAVRSGGILTGAALLEQRGAWLWNRPTRIDVLLPRGASAPTPLASVRFTFGSRPRGVAAVSTDCQAIDHAVRRLPFEEAVAILDWAWHTGRLDLFGLHELCQALPRRIRHIVEWCDRDCQSVLESVVRTRLRRAGYRVTSQVPVAGTRSIDLVVEGVVGLELDGRTFHADTFESDRAKDLSIVLEGRAAMRVSFAMVRETWPSVEAAVGSAVSMHRQSRRRRRAAGIQTRNARLPHRE